jgi:hypothetical protein
MNYHTEDGKQRFSIKVEVLRSLFAVWLEVLTIHPKKGEYSDRVLSCIHISLIVPIALSVGDGKRVYRVSFS